MPAKRLPKKFLPVSKKQLQDKIRKYNETHCLKVTGTKTQLRHAIEGRKGLHMPKPKKRATTGPRTKPGYMPAFVAKNKKKLAAAKKKVAHSYASTFKGPN